MPPIQVFAHSVIPRYCEGNSTNGPIERVDLLPSPANYDLFALIGVDEDYGMEEPLYVGPYLLYQYPDSTIIRLEAKGSELHIY